MPHHVALAAESGAPRTARSYFVLPVSYRRRRSPTPCAAITAMSLCFSKSEGTEAFDPAVGGVARRVESLGRPVKLRTRRK
jgi:hypothetical protein